MSGLWRPPAWGPPDKRESRPTARSGDLVNGRKASGDGAHHSANPKPLQFRTWRPYWRSTLHGFVSISAPSIGLEIDDIAVHVKGERRWVSLTTRAMVSSDGQLLRDEKGKIRHASPLRWLTHGLAGPVLRAGHRAATAAPSKRAR